ncbi:uncharacterized protein E6C27_scaffold108G00180 [Cucumis melo var. makuwa]|uniref:Uncharacterized protein n=1 Tax=Cucumis melo var. makuwa TaxID=1194695 RepID=A0A5A7UXK9_CUCMM|nr:uncharacterized protein E6C27_scaffold108G00180 [Cucumis melo var. makuwa]
MSTGELDLSHLKERGGKVDPADEWDVNGLGDTSTQSIFSGNVSTKNNWNKDIIDVGQTRRESRVGENPILDVMHNASGVASGKRLFPTRQAGVLSRRLGYSKGLGWGPKPKGRRTTSVSSSSTSYPQSIQKEIELQVKLNEALEWIEVQDRNHQVLASQVEQMQKLR